MKTVLTTAIALTFMSAVAAQAAGVSPLGNWARGDGAARVVITNCGANLCATNTWIKPGTPSEKKGDVLVMKVKPTSDTKYAGSAFDPQRNMNYKISMVVGENKMTTKGCVLGGLLCKAVNWTKID